MRPEPGSVAAAKAGLRGDGASGAGVRSQPARRTRETTMGTSCRVVTIGTPLALPNVHLLRTRVYRALVVRHGQRDGVQAPRSVRVRGILCGRTSPVAEGPVVGAD